MRDNILLLGEGGLSKSYITKDFDCSEFNGHITPYRAFQLIKEHPNRNIKFDDMDTLIESKDMVKLLKQCCELADTKQVMFKTTRNGAKDEKEEVANFTGYNLIILNKLKSLDEKNLSALATRFYIIEFKPSKAEVFKYLCGYAKDKEILKEIGFNLRYMVRLNLRLYEHLKRLKKAKMDWEDYLVKWCNLSKRDEKKRKLIKEVQSALKENICGTKQIAKFSGSRRSYFRYKKECQNIAKNTDYVNDGGKQ